MLLQAMWMSVLIGVLGGLLAFLVAWNRLHAFLKPMSEVLQEKLKYISLPDHRAKTGYQNEVSRRGVALWPPSRSTTVLQQRLDSGNIFLGWLSQCVFHAEHCRIGRGGGKTSKVHTSTWSPKPSATCGQLRTQLSNPGT
jgi:hypothetical protein